jgi:TrmH family RNA methyltransferase
MKGQTSGDRGAFLITSTTNDKVKRAIALRDRRERDRTGLMLIEGIRELSRAVEGGVSLEVVFSCPAVPAGDDARALLASLRSREIRIAEVTARVFEKLALREGSGGLIAVARQPGAGLERLPRSGEALFLVAHAIEKPGNLGAVIRSADGAGASGVIACDAGTDLYNPNTVRASIGTIFAVPTVSAAADETIAWLRETGARIVAAAPGKGTLYTEIDFPGRAAIVVGAEDAGLPGFWIEAADALATIPMRGAADSLNVSATAAILLYEALRRRGSA